MRQRSAPSGRTGLLVGHQPCTWPRESHGLDVPGLRCHVLLAADRPDMLGAGWRCSGALTVTCTNGSIGLIPMVGSAAAAFPRDISAELVKVLGCVPVSVLLAFMASTERPPHTSARAESGVVLGAREVAEVRKFVSTGRPGFGCSNRPSNHSYTATITRAVSTTATVSWTLPAARRRTTARRPRSPPRARPPLISENVRRCPPAGKGFGPPPRRVTGRYDLAVVQIFAHRSISSAASINSVASARA